MKVGDLPLLGTRFRSMGYDWVVLLDAGPGFCLATRLDICLPAEAVLMPRPKPEEMLPEPERTEPKGRRS